jgi:uncharacterized protein (DUF1499 family)|tara:strand:- start:4440 stop:5066 length:627 start_codon:yes stop_codon:yes gene_type:complete
MLARVPLRCVASTGSRDAKKDARTSGRRVILRNVAASPFFLGLFNFAAPIPNNLGVGEFNGIVTGLSLCPPTPNCVGTSDEFNDPVHYIPAWTYNDEEKVKRGGTETTRDEAMRTLARVVENTDCDGYAPKIVEQTNDYMRVEYTSKVFGFVDDVEFWFPPDDEKRRSRVEYRSASRVGESDLDANRKRIKCLRQALAPEGWKSIGFS